MTIVPSDYELAAWQAIQDFTGRPLSKGLRQVAERVNTGAARVGKQATEYLGNHPRAKGAADRATKGAQLVGRGVRKAAGVVPDGMVDWSDSALSSMRRTMGRVSRAGLSAKRIVAKHQRLGHEVSSLLDLRHLDLEQIDAVRGRGASWYYPAAAAAVGAGAGLVTSGGGC